MTLHDHLLPLAPMILYWEYKLGVWVMGRSGDVEVGRSLMKLSFREVMH